MPVQDEHTWSSYTSIFDVLMQSWDVVVFVCLYSFYNNFVGTPNTLLSLDTRFENTLHGGPLIRITYFYSIANCRMLVCINHFSNVNTLSSVRVGVPFLSLFYWNSTVTKSLVPLINQGHWNTGTWGWIQELWVYPGIFQTFMEK